MNEYLNEWLAQKEARKWKCWDPWSALNVSGKSTVKTKCKLFRNSFCHFRDFRVMPRIEGKINAAFLRQKRFLGRFSIMFDARKWHLNWISPHRYYQSHIYEHHFPTFAGNWLVYWVSFNSLHPFVNWFKVLKGRPRTSNNFDLTCQGNWNNATLDSHASMSMWDNH